MGVQLVGGRRLEIPRRDVFALHFYGLLPPRADEPEPKKKRKRVPAAGTPGGLRSAAFLDIMGAETISEPGTEQSSAWEMGQLSRRGQNLHDNLVAREAVPMEFHLALLCCEPHGPVRIRKNDFDFSSLGEQRQSHSLDNFLILLEEVLAHLPEAWTREPAVRFLTDLDPGPILYFKAEEAQNLERWLYQWARIQADEA